MQDRQLECSVHQLVRADASAVGGVATGTLIWRLAQKSTVLLAPVQRCTCSSSEEAHGVQKLRILSTHGKDEVMWVQSSVVML